MKIQEENLSYKNRLYGQELDLINSGRAQWRAVVVIVVSMYVQGYFLIS
jgi:hypothetical protein